MFSWSVQIISDYMKQIQATGYFVVQCAIVFWNKPCAVVDNSSLHESEDPGGF